MPGCSSPAGPRANGTEVEDGGTLTGGELDGWTLTVVDASNGIVELSPPPGAQEVVPVPGCPSLGEVVSTYVVSTQLSYRVLPEPRAPMPWEQFQREAAALIEQSQGRGR